MPDGILGDRRQALEASFFAKENAKLVEKLNAERRQQSAREGLAEVSKISDEALLDKLLALGVGADTWAAISLVPLVAVAWADGSVHEKERLAMLAAAQADGLAEGGPSYLLLESWMERRPDESLLANWGKYMAGVCERLDDAGRAALKSEIMDRARGVAEAAGGILGLGNKVSPEEEAALTQLEKAFDS